MSNILSSVLDDFRVAEENADAIPVLGDEEAIRVLAAWSKTDQSWRKPRRRMPQRLPTNRAALWAWVVEGWIIDEDAIVKGSGLVLRVVREKLAMLIANRLIYPTGDMAKGARAAMHVYIAAKLGTKTKRDRQRPNERPKPDDDAN